MDHHDKKPTGIGPEKADISAPGLPVKIYRGNVMHARMKPVSHRFNYSMASILIDIDRLAEANQLSAIFSVNKSNLVSFFEKDFGPRDGSPLRPHVDALMLEAGLPPSARIRLLCYPRVLGYGFNPISVYFCGDLNGALECMIYEVKNTFGEAHTYIEPVCSGQVSPAGLRQEARKQFYVSPFLDMGMTYLFRVKPPSDTVALRILEVDANGPILAASFFGKISKFSTGSLAKIIIAYFGMTWKVIGGIHYEALRLWLKGMKIRPRLAHKLSHSLPDGYDKGKPLNNYVSGGGRFDE